MLILLTFSFCDTDAGSNEPEKIAEFRKAYTPYELFLRKRIKENFDLMGVEIDEEKTVIHKPVSKDFTVYCYPKEIDYYTDAVKKENRLISFDTPLIPERIPQPFKLPEEFAKKPGKIIYVSLGSMFSMYTALVQRLVDLLAKLPYKYIVSKGPMGEQIKFPNDNFIGENYVDQLAVLQVADAMIAHGGNNTLGECFYFGVPCIVLPVFVDQVMNFDFA